MWVGGFSLGRVTLSPAFASTLASALASSSLCFVAVKTEADHVCSPTGEKSSQLPWGREE